LHQIDTTRSVPEQDEIAIRVRGVSVTLGSSIVLDNLDLEVRRGEIMGVVGPSGVGKSVLLRCIVGLIRPWRGTIQVLGHDLASRSESELSALQQRWGILFQNGALFTSLTVAQNVEVPLREHTSLPKDVIEELCALKIGLVGLASESAAKYPAELSGGMRKRAGLARALALDPEILFLDEPTSALDPIGAAALDELIGGLRQNLGLTVLMVTHDLDSLHAIADRIAVLCDKCIVAVGTMQDMLRHDHPWISEYFRGPRGHAALGARPA
jgi:phospholipid/cholesterol/gamma-HCH transport system ATP-binding protein